MTKRLSIDLPVKRWEELQSYADEEGMTLTELATWILKDYAPPIEIGEDEA